MSRLYERLCRRVNQLVGVDRETLESRREEKRDKFLESKDDLRRAEVSLREASILDGKGSKEYKEASSEVERKKKILKRAKESYTQERFEKTVYFTGMDLVQEEVLNFAVVVFLTTFFALLTGIYVYHIYRPMSIVELTMYVIPTLLIIPLLSLLFTANYPEILEKRLQAESIGKAPESINYMTMSMRVKPSLFQALKFASENAEEPMASGLKKVLWEVYTRKRSSIEESFMAFALEWGEWNDDLKRSLFSIRSAVLEKTKEGLEGSLERANDIIIDGTKQQVKEFSDSLSMPTTVLFAIGIILPIMIGALLPMMSISDLDMMQEQTTSGVGIFQMVLMMNIVTPIAAFMYSYYILSKRPGTVSLPRVDLREDKTSAFIAFIIFVILFFVFYISRGSLSYLMPLPLLWPPVFSLSFYLLVTSSKPRQTRREFIKMEKEFPDTLFQLGSRLAEGAPVETALTSVSKSMEGAKIAELFTRISNTCRLHQMSMETVLFGKEGMLNEHPSSMIRASMKAVVSLSKKVAGEAGLTVMRISNYLKDMQMMEEDMRSELYSSVQMMEATSMFFAPVVMGVVTGMYHLLYEIFLDISGAQLISPSNFTAVISVYLLTTGFVVTYFTEGIKSRNDPIEFRYSLGRMLLVCTVLYSTVLWLSGLLL